MIKTFVKILSLAKEYKYWMLLSAFIGFLTVGSSIGLMMTSAYIISKAALHVHIHELQVGIVGVRFFGVSRGIFRYLERLVSHETTFRLLAKFRIWLFKNLVSLTSQKSGSLTSGDLLNRSVGNIEKLEHIFVRVISPPLIAFLILLLMSGLLAIFNIYYSIVFAALYLFTGIAVPSFAYWLSKNYGEKVLELKARLSELTVDAAQGMKELIVFNKTSEWIGEFNEVNNELLRLEKRLNSMQGLNSALIGFMMNATVFVFFLIAGTDVLNGNLSGVSLASILIGLMASFEALLPLPQSMIYLRQSLSAAEGLFELEELSAGQIKREHKNKIQEVGRFNISFNDVKFSYGNGEVLKNINFHLENNSLNAIVGATGSGKSTLMSLLTGLRLPDSGEIKIGDVNIEEMEEEYLRGIMAVIPQDVSLFTGTIEQNLLFAKEDATKEQIEDALKKAKLDEFVNGLPKGIKTEIGELGKMLSGGERKRLAIARAILKDAPIIIGDEITNGLDEKTESEILEEMKILSSNKTIILITHRFMRMDIYDKIIAIADGTIVAEGKHNELFDKNESYRKYYKSFSSRLDF